MGAVGPPIRHNEPVPPPGATADHPRQATRRYHVEVSDPFLGASELTADARRLLSELDRDTPSAGAIDPDCRPPLDVFETMSSLEIVADIPAVPASSVRVAIRRSTLLIVGAKVPAGVDTAARFHVAERSYGRFARVVRLNGAFDAAGARATVRAGQLRVSLPRLEDRRGRMLRIPVESE